MADSQLRSLRIGLSPTSVTVLGRRGWIRPRTEIVADISSVDGAFDTEERLSELLAALPKRKNQPRLPATVVLADGLLRYFMVTPPSNLSSIADCKAAASMRFHALYDESSAGWEVRADWNATQPFLACAMRRGSAQALESIFRRFGLVQVQVVPQLIAAINSRRKFLKTDTWVGAIHQQTLTIAAIRAKRLGAVRTVMVPRPAIQDSNWLHAHLVREALLANVCPPRAIEMHGVLPATWEEKKSDTLVKSIVPAVRTSPAGKISAGVALALIGAAP